MLPQIITLPCDSFTLTANCSSETSQEFPYQYEWSFTSDINLQGTVETWNEKDLKVSNPEEGIYKFKVNVKGRTLENTPSEGNTTVKVLVLEGRKCVFA